LALISGESVMRSLGLDFTNAFVGDRVAAAN
jgi:hypothetical protein